MLTTHITTSKAGAGVLMASTPCWAWCASAISPTAAILMSILGTQAVSQCLKVPYSNSHRHDSAAAAHLVMFYGPHHTCLHLPTPVHPCIKGTIVGAWALNPQ